jgi:hypothetical protein
MGRNMRNVKEKEYGGEGGIRTHGTVSRTLAFEASTFNRSVTSPRLFLIVTDGLLSRQCTVESSNWKGTSYSHGEIGVHESEADLARKNAR